LTVVGKLATVSPVIGLYQFKFWVVFKTFSTGWAKSTLDLLLIAFLQLILRFRDRIVVPVSSKISDFAPCAHAQINIFHTKYAEKTNDQDLGFSL